MHLAGWLALCLMRWAPEPASPEPVVAPPPPVVAPPAEASAPQPAALDPALVARNRQLTARAQRGDRFLIAGRVVGSVAGLVMGGGIAMLVVHYVTDREGRELLVAGAVLTGVGGAFHAGSGGLVLHGKREVEAARRGQLRPAHTRGGPRRAVLAGPGWLRVRF